MKQFHTVFYWFGGVLAPPLERAAALHMGLAPWHVLGADVRLALGKAAEALTLGQIGDDDFCSDSVKAGQAAIAPEQLANRLCGEVQLRPGVLDVIRRLPARYEQWVVADYPHEWLRAIGDRGGLWDVLPADRCLQVAGWRLTRLVPDLFYRLAAETRRSPDDCIIIDANTARAVVAVRHRFSSTIFVDARRLEKDYVLREMMG